MNIAASFAAADRVYENSLAASRKSASSPRSSANRSSPYGGSDGSSSGIFASSGENNAARQYAALKDIPFTAIRPIAVSVANQPWRVGVKRKSSAPRGMVTKTLRLAPDFMAKAISEGIEVIPNHPLLDVLENPNGEICGWSQMWCTAMSLEATGSAYWLIDRDSDTSAERTDGSLGVRLWYLPKHWVHRVTVNGMQTGWKVTPPGVMESDAPEIPLESMIRFYKPDPANPAGDFSVLQSQALAVNTDDEVQKSQHAAMANATRPGMVIVAGDVEHPNGGKQQVTFTPEQRTQIINAIRLAYRGAEHVGDPIILDGLIKDAYPYTRNPAEMDFLNGAKLTKERIMMGIGTNPIVAGQVEGANRATAYVAQFTFFQNVVNPIITMISQVATMKIAPLFSTAGESLHIWMDKAEAFDADLQMAKVGLLIDAKAITKDELREYADMEPLGKEKGGEDFAGPAEGGPAPVETKPQKGGRK